jgi:hypothetical protein
MRSTPERILISLGSDIKVRTVESSGNYNEKRGG